VLNRDVGPDGRARSWGDSGVPFAPEVAKTNPNHANLVSPSINGKFSVNSLSRRSLNQEQGNALAALFGSDPVFEPDASSPAAAPPPTALTETPVFNPVHISDRETRGSGNVADAYQLCTDFLEENAAPVPAAAGVTRSAASRLSQGGVESEKRGLHRSVTMATASESAAMLERAFGKDVREGVEKLRRDQCATMPSREGGLAQGGARDPESLMALLQATCSPAAEDASKAYRALEEWTKSPSRSPPGSPNPAIGTGGGIAVATTESAGSSPGHGVASCRLCEERGVSAAPWDSYDVPANSDGIFLRWRKHPNEARGRGPSQGSWVLPVPEIPARLGRGPGERDPKDAEAEAAYLRRELEKKDGVIQRLSRLERREGGGGRHGPPEETRDRSVSPPPNEFETQFERWTRSQSHITPVVIITIYGRMCYK